MYRYLITCAQGFEDILNEELEAFGVQEIKRTHGGIWCQGELRTAYELCLHLRTASRVLLHVQEADITDRQSLLLATQRIPWSSYVKGTDSFVVHSKGTNKELNHTGFISQVIKDGYLDYWEQFDQRPSVEKKDANVSIRTQMHKGKMDFFIDLSGQGLHERGYRLGTGAAPIRETLAAALVHRLRTNLNLEQPTAIYDPSCGSGTLLLEAAMVLTDTAPGLFREYWGFMAWRQHDEELWQNVRKEALLRKREGLAKCSTKFYASDMDPKVLAMLHRSIRQLGFDALFEYQVLDLSQHAIADFVGEQEQGVILTNPPYGERLGSELQSQLYFQKLGQHLYELQGIWFAGILAPDETKLRALKMRAQRKYPIKNGPLDILFATFDIHSQERREEAGNQDIANRLKKNWKTRQQWLKREKNIEVYRLYDADLPEYNAAIDVYGEHLVIQEYLAPKSIPEGLARQRFWGLVEAAVDVLPFNVEHIHLKERKRQKGHQQYEKQQVDPIRFVVQEYGAQFWVNLTQYLDTGLFHDHRLVRRDIQRLSKDKKVLNLFAYTGSASVHAALGGASQVTTIDMSRTYLNWAIDNFRLNQLSISQHVFIQEDCMTWLQEQNDFVVHGKKPVRKPSRVLGTAKPVDGEKWDLIFMDPPTFSNSKRMEGVLDTQRDHVDMLAQLKPLLVPQGMVIFSTNKERFKLDEAALKAQGWAIEDKTQQSIPEDFKRQKNIHYCWYLTHA